jgi:hypothetical protein
MATNPSVTAIGEVIDIKNTSKIILVSSLGKTVDYLDLSLQYLISNIGIMIDYTPGTGPTLTLKQGPSWQISG